MNISIEAHESNLLVTLDGDITANFSDKLREEVKKHLTKSVKTMCVDMRRVSMIDSAGLSVLFGIKIMCGSQNAHLYLLSPTGVALDTLEKVSFDKVFELIREEAVEPLLRQLFGER